MPKCPKCGQEIDHLREWDKAWRGFDFSIDEAGNPEYDEVDNYTEDGGEIEWECPECGETLFQDEKEAIDFLKS